MSTINAQNNLQSAAFKNALRGTDLEGFYGPDKAEGPAQKDAAVAFGEKLLAELDTVNGTMEAADTTAESYLTGEDTSIHEVMIAMTKADVSFRMMTTVSRKVLEAYQEINRMQV